MKNAFLILFGALTLTFFSCTDEQQESSEFTEINVRSEKSDCDEFLKQINSFVPDTEEEIHFFENIKDPKNISKQEVEKYVEIMGFKDMESFYKSILELSKSDCARKEIQENSEEKKANCGWGFVNCMIDAVLDFGSTDILPYEIANFISDVFDCVEDFIDCAQ